MTQPFIVVIPARHASSRLPGKPLLPIGGCPMIGHVLERARESGAERVLVATDDTRILEAVHALGGNARMTSANHLSGTDRLAEVAEIERFHDDAIVVNLQGDEPFVPGALIARLAERLAARSDCGIATLATPIRQSADLFDANVVKVVLDASARALTFSRAPIPWVRGLFGPGFEGTLPSDVPFLRHVGLYAYRVGTLRRIAALPASALERAESLEQLRALDAGIGIHVTVVERAPGHGVDTAEDLDRAERELLLFRTQGESTRRTSE